MNTDAEWQLSSNKCIFQNYPCSVSFGRGFACLIIGRRGPFYLMRICTATSQYRTFNVQAQGHEADLLTELPSGAAG